MNPGEKRLSGIAVVFCLVCGLNPVSVSGQTPLVAGFDSTKGGIWSFPIGEAFGSARSILSSMYPAAGYRSMGTLAALDLAGVDILVLASARTNTSAITPLSSDEQEALGDFVRGGGCAILMVDNANFDINAGQANESLVDPFDLDVGGTIWGPATATVANPSSSPLTSGAHGSVTTFMQNYPGGLSSLGASAACLATNSLGCALAVIGRGNLQTGSGLVVIYSDLNQFGDSDSAGMIGNSSNQALYKNTLGFCAPIIVEIDIRPDSDRNQINLGSGGSVPVAILSTATFDAITVDPLTVTLAGAAAKLKGKGSPLVSQQDVNGDGLLDLVVHVDTIALELSQGNTQAVLRGLTYDGSSIKGVDTVRIHP